MDDCLHLFTPLDVIAMSPRDPLCDAALWAAYMRQHTCLLCDEPVCGQVAYVAILVPGDGPPWTTSVCRSCGTQDDRPNIERRVVERTALHAYTAGSA